MKTRAQIDLGMIDDNPWQPRQEIEPNTLALLADSIHSVGLMQAPLGRWTADGRVSLPFGHRRVAAVRLLRERALWPDHIEMDVDDDIPDEKMAVMAISENVARQRLTQIQVVRAHRRAVDETRHSIQSLADDLGVSRSALSNNLRVLELPDFVLQHVKSGALRVSVAREFLVLQNTDHAHTDDVQAVINAITDNYRVQHQGALPNWSRRSVRKEISERVANNEQDFRPLGRREAGMPGLAGASRETTFDIEAFSQERPDAIHTIPAGDKSRVWTCDVREWRRRQTQASREANKQAQAACVSRETPGTKGSSRDHQFEQALAKDPVWRGIVANREKKGPIRPTTDEEKAALGTRAVLKDVDANDNAFWKILENGRPEDVHYWDTDRSGERVPSFFKLSGCKGCVAGAAYGKSRHGYRISGVKLICTNKTCYTKKLAGDEAVHREQVVAQLLDVNRQDDQAIRDIMGRIALLSRRDLRTLAATLIAAQPELQLHHAMSVPHKKWSYKSTAVAFVTGMLVHKPAQFDRYGNNRGKAVLDLESVNDVPDGDLLELTATLMAYHLRQAGRIEGVSRETEGTPDPLGC